MMSLFIDGLDVSSLLRMDSVHGLYISISDCQDSFMAISKDGLRLCSVRDLKNHGLIGFIDYCLAVPVLAKLDPLLVSTFLKSLLSDFGCDSPGYQSCVLARASMNGLLQDVSSSISFVLDSCLYKSTGVGLFSDV
jgi:hypothetical protein